MRNLQIDPKSKSCEQIIKAVLIWNFQPHWNWFTFVNNEQTLFVHFNLPCASNEINIIPSISSSWVYECTSPEQLYYPCCAALNDRDKGPTFRVRSPIIYCEQNANTFNPHSIVGVALYLRQFLLSHCVWKRVKPAGLWQLELLLLEPWSGQKWAISMFLLKCVFVLHVYIWANSAYANIARMLNS